MFLGKKVRKLREERNLSLRDLAKKSGIASFSYLANIERGVVDDPGIKTVIKLADGLGISINDLINKSEV